MVGVWSVEGTLTSAEGDTLHDTDGTQINPGGQTFVDTWTVKAPPVCLSADNCTMTVWNAKGQPLSFLLQGDSWTAGITASYHCDDRNTTSMATGTFTMNRVDGNIWTGTRVVTSDDACGTVLVQTDTVTATLQ